MTGLTKRRRMTSKRASQTKWQSSHADTSPCGTAVGAAVRQIVFEIADAADEDDGAEESEHVWPTLLSSDGSGQVQSSGLPGGAELYSNDLCRLSVLELGSESRAVRLRFDTPGEADLTISPTFSKLQALYC
jgi:hypothetical protein